MSPSATGLTLHRSASVYVANGYSVFPVWGDVEPKRAKQAAVTWLTYQKRLPNAQELADWFLSAHYGGVAIATGRVSGLVVLDFDDAEKADLFVRTFPELAQTRVVYSATRQLPHFYYHIRPQQRISSRHVAGIDLQSDGCYIVAPPTTIGGRAYRSNGKLPLELTDQQARQIIGFINAIAHKEALQESTPEPTPTARLSESQATAIYRYHAPRIGRNNALFQVAVRLRDALWHIDDVLRVLVPLHARQPARGESSRNEMLAARKREAQATIRSAFTRAPRQDHHQPVTHVPNTIRERLLRHNQVQVARLLDALVLRGATLGGRYSERQITELVRGCVGRYSVLAALEATFADGTPIFEALRPFPRPHTLTNVASTEENDEFLKCHSFAMPLSNKIKNHKKGRPPVVYTLPTLEHVALKLGVTLMKGDALSEADLKSPASYRTALHREFIMRRAGQYMVSYFCVRLNVTRRTVHRYNRRAGVTVVPQYDSVPVTWKSVETLDWAMPHRGHFVQDMNGKRYPMNQDVGRMLLIRKLRPRLMRQRENYYWHKDGVYASESLLGIAPRSPKNAENQGLSGLKLHLQHEGEKVAKNTSSRGVTPAVPVATVQATLPNLSAPLPLEPSAKPKRAKRPPKPPKPKSARYYTRPLKDESAERLANTLRDTLGLKLKLARRLVDERGQALVNDALKVMRQRDNIRNPAGFLIVFLRSEANASSVC